MFDYGPAAVLHWVLVYAVLTLCFHEYKKNINRKGLFSRGEGYVEDKYLIQQREKHGGIEPDETLLRYRRKFVLAAIDLVANDILNPGGLPLIWHLNCGKNGMYKLTLDRHYCFGGNCELEKYTQRHEK